MKRDQKVIDFTSNNNRMQLFDDIKMDEIFKQLACFRNISDGQTVVVNVTDAPIPIVNQMNSISKTKVMQTIINRLNAPTPSFFKVLRNIGLVVVAVSGVVLTAPLALPAAVVTIAGYVAVGGSIVAAVSQLTTKPVAQVTETQGDSLSSYASPVTETEGGSLETPSQQ